MKDTIEEKVLMLQNKKRSIADSFVRQNNPFETLDKSEWEDLFK
jgi:SNF2 family DNA or RNA helicase